MTYSLRFHEEALKEWEKLDTSVKNVFKKKLSERLISPRVVAAKLKGMEDCYKIKLQNAGYRLIYRVDETVVFVTVIAVGKRDKMKVYKTAKNRV